MAIAPKPSEKTPIPRYMVSFGDMMTNILTFFILLCSFAKQQEAGLLHDGVGSFKDEVGRAGIPSLTRAYDDLIELFEEPIPYVSRDRAYLTEEAWEEFSGRMKSSDMEAMDDVETSSFEALAELSLNVPGVFAAGSKDLTQEQR